MPKKNNITYIKPSDPPFLQRLKQTIGYKAGPTVDTKKETLPLVDNAEDTTKDDEKPVVVVLRQGDLTQEEADLVMKNQSPDEEPQESSRIMFKKPSKRSAEEGEASASSDDQSSKKKKTKSVKDIDKKSGHTKKVKSSRLLSFGADEEDD